jgi:hypothetical protein
MRTVIKLVTKRLRRHWPKTRIVWHIGSPHLGNILGCAACVLTPHNITVALRPASTSGTGCPVQVESGPPPSGASCRGAASLEVVRGYEPSNKAP